MGYPPSINATMGQGDMSEMEMVTGCTVYGAGVGTNDMDRKRSQLRSQFAILSDENNTYGYLW